MARTYTLDGIPNDLLTSDYIGDRSLKVALDPTVVEKITQNPTGLIDKTFTWNTDGSINTITEFNNEREKTILKTFSYDNDGNITSIVSVYI